MARVRRDELPASAVDILELLRRVHDETGNEWLTRTDIAQAQDKRRMNASEMTHLEYLDALGFVEIQRPVGETAYQYRLIDSD